MLFSAFAPFGMFEFSGDLSEGEKIYNAIRASYTDPKTGKEAIDCSPTTHHGAKLYAHAMACAAASVTTKRAENQIQPDTAYELLPAHARKYGVPREPGELVGDWRARVVDRKALLRGARHEAIVQGLLAILGDAFIDYIVTDHDEAEPLPVDPSLGPGVFSRPDLPSKTVRIVEPIVPATLPSSVTVVYENWNTNEPEIDLVVGDVLCVQPETDGLDEKITVTAVSGNGDGRAFTAVFTKTHDQDCAATTGPVPIWTSLRRAVLIVATQAAATNPDLRRRVDEFMARVSRVVTQWQMVHPTSPGATTIGPFTLDSSELGCVTLEQIPIDYTPTAPGIISVSPAMGPVAGGTIVTITGVGLMGASLVSFDGIPATILHGGYGAIVCTTPAHAAGLVAVSITTPNGTTTASNAFQYV